MRSDFEAGIGSAAHLSRRVRGGRWHRRSAGSGGGVSPAPGPSPTPSPTPTPSATPSFSPVAMQLFGDTLYNTDVRVLGHGTLAGPTGPNEPLPYKKFVEANDLAVTYDAAGKLYRVDAGVAGKGVLFQVGPEETDQFPTVVADDAAAAKAVSPEIFVKPAGNDRGFRYVAQVWPWTTTSPGTTGNMFYFGAFGVAQQTRDADVPAAGTVRYAGSLLGWFAGDPGAEGLGGVVTLDLDFAGPERIRPPGREVLLHDGLRISRRRLHADGDAANVGEHLRRRCHAGRRARRRGASAVCWQDRVRQKC